MLYELRQWFEHTSLIGSLARRLVQNYTISGKR
jgi:hypothetical protein